VATAMGMAATATHRDAKCSLRYVPSVAKTLRCHSSLAKVDQCIVAIVTIRSDLADHASLLFDTYIGQGVPDLCMSLERELQNLRKGVPA